jgi:hypothetical protein
MSLWAPKDPSELDQMATTLYSTGWHIEWFLFSILRGFVSRLRKSKQSNFVPPERAR